MSTVLSIMDRGEWGACTDNIVVADPIERRLLWVPRDLWSERLGGRINRAFAEERHDGLLRALAENGIAAEHSLCLRREAVEQALASVSVSVPVAEPLKFWYPLAPNHAIEEGRKLVAFDPPEELLEGERTHQWIGARVWADDRRRPLLETSDFARIRRQQLLLRRLLDEGFDFGQALADPELVSASGPEAIGELELVDPGWHFSLVDDVRTAWRSEMHVLERLPAGTSGSDDALPAASVVVLSYNSRDRIDIALQSMRAQDLEEPFEVIVVDSGEDGCADHIATTFPEMKVIRSRSRLWPGAARNRGILEARGECVAFLSDDCAARPDWLRRRLELHRHGFDLVGGAVLNGTPRSPVGTADYLLEYSAVLPSGPLLRAQRIPHSVSYSRRGLARAGEFPETVRTGEDTIFNERVMRNGGSVAFDPGIQITHANPTRLLPYLRHLYVHGVGLMQCVDAHGLHSTSATERGGLLRRFAATFFRYPARRWWNSLFRIARGRARDLPAYLALSPLVWIGLWATSLGAWSQLRSIRGGTSQALASDNGSDPEISVVVAAYQSRRRIDQALESLRKQDLEEPWEAIVVDSGDDGTAEYVAEKYPEVRVVHSSRRMYPAAAFNTGVRTARGRFVALLPDDGIAERDWLRRRLQRHREGHGGVGGAITNGTPWHPVGTAAYFVEFSALLPNRRILEEQAIPHCLSYEREVFREVGGHPENLRTGEDTVLNARLMERGVAISVDPEIRMAHVNLTSLRRYLAHHYELGHGFGLAGGSYGPPSGWMAGASHLRAAGRILLRYPLTRWSAALRRIALGQPRSLPAYLLLTPLVWAALWASALGRWAGWRRRPRSAQPAAAPPA